MKTSKTADFNIAWKRAVQRLRQSKNPESQAAYKHLTSYQYRVSLKILGVRISQNLTHRQAAAKCGMSVKKYDLFENGIDMLASEEDYRRVYENLRK